MREHRTEDEITGGRDPNLWALDLEDPIYSTTGRCLSKGVPTAAHLIVDTSTNERGEEVRTSACGIKYTKLLDDHGWWGSRSGELAMAPEHTHCGADQIR